MSDKPTVNPALMTEGPVAKQLLQHSGAMLVGIASIIILNVTDTFFIGQLGPHELAAISFTFPVTMLIIAMTLGINIGSSAIISRAVGQSDHQETQQLTTSCLAFALLLVLATTLIGFLTIDPLFRLLGADELQLLFIHQYMDIWYLGVGLVVIPMVGNSAIRAHGDSKTPSRIMLLSAGINMILDPLLIFGIGPFPRLELAGAAFATLIAYSVTFIVSVWVLTHKLKLITFKRHSLSILRKHWNKLLRLALPAAGTNIMNPVTAAVLTHIIATQGHFAVAGYGVGTRIESIATIGLMALSSVLTPFIGQNLGANKPERVIAALRFCQRFAIIWGIGAMVILFFCSGLIASLFSDSVETQSITQRYLMIMPLSYVGLGMVVFSASMFNAFHQPIPAAKIVLLRLLVLTIPMAILGLWLYDITGMFIGMAVANLIAGANALWLMRKMLKEFAQQNGLT